MNKNTTAAERIAYLRGYLAGWDSHARGSTGYQRIRYRAELTRLLKEMKR